MKATSIALVALAALCFAGCAEDKPKATPEKTETTKAPEAAPGKAAPAPATSAKAEGGW